jgi:hypothetical protein
MRSREPRAGTCRSGSFRSSTGIKCANLLLDFIAALFVTGEDNWVRIQTRGSCRRDYLSPRPSALPSGCRNEPSTVVSLSGRVVACHVLASVGRFERSSVCHQNRFVASSCGVWVGSTAISLSVQRAAGTAVEWGLCAYLTMRSSSGRLPPSSPSTASLFGASSIGATGAGMVTLEEIQRITRDCDVIQESHRCSSDQSGDRLLRRPSLTSWLA